MTVSLCNSHGCYYELTHAITTISSTSRNDKLVITGDKIWILQNTYDKQKTTTNKLTNHPQR